MKINIQNKTGPRPSNSMTRTMRRMKPNKNMKTSTNRSMRTILKRLQMNKKGNKKRRRRHDYPSYKLHSHRAQIVDFIQ